MMHDSKKIASLIVGMSGGGKPKSRSDEYKDSYEDQQDFEDNDEEMYDYAMMEAMEYFMKAVKDGDVKSACKYLDEWHTISHKEYDEEYGKNDTPRNDMMSDAKAKRDMKPGY